MDLERNIYEGWRPIDFINELEPSFIAIMSGQSWHKPFKTSNELKKWCMDNQPYYKKHIPEVFNNLKIMEKKLGRIENVKFGIGGYQNAMIGLHITLGNNDWGVQDSRSAWDAENIKYSKNSKWTEADRDKKIC